MPGRIGLTRLTRSRPTARGLAVLAIAAFLLSPLAAPATSSLLSADGAVVAAAEQNIELGPATANTLQVSCGKGKMVFAVYEQTDRK